MQSNRSSASKKAAKKVVPAKKKKTKTDADVSEVSSQKILGLLHTKFGTDLSLYKPSTIQRRLMKQMMLEKHPDLKSYEKHLKKDPTSLKKLHDSLFIHVTQFFRDPEKFKELKKSVLLPLIKQYNPGDIIRIWVAGCSTGEEAYSLAMVLSEVMESKDLNLKFQIFATDVSETAIQKARKGFYTKDQIRGVDKKRLSKFFEKSGDGYKVSKELRDRCIFSRHDLTRNPPFAKLDFISCRNVLIYFNSTLQKQVLSIFHYALRPGGYTWLGPSESISPVAKAFKQPNKKVKIYQKSDDVKIKLPRSGFDSNNITDIKKDEPAHRNDGLKNADKIILEKYAPPGVVISRDCEILQFRGRTAPFLEQPTGQPTLNILKMAQRDLILPLRTLIQQSFKKNATICKEALLKFPKVTKTVTLEITPINPKAPENERQYLILFIPGVSDKKPSKARVSAQADDSTAQYIEELLKEIETKNEYHRSLIEQFEAAQEELTSSNEELQATNEELQSTNEELETAQEELQASNEELTSMNDELQNRNTELIRAYETLARGEDRFRMMVDSVKDYAIFMLDPDGRVESWNEGARRVKGYEASEILGHHFSEFYPPEAIASHTSQKELDTARIEGRVEDEGWRIRKDGTRFWANTVITRMNNFEGELIGFTKVTRDLTERKHAEEELLKSEERFRTMVNIVRDYAIIMLDVDGNITSWNEGARRIKGYESNEIIGSHFSRFYLPEDIARNHPQEELKIAVDTGKYEEEGWRVKKDGSTFWANVVITRLDDATGKHIGFVKVTRDLTERKKAEEALKRLNENLEKRVEERTNELQVAVKVRDEFLSIASHELKTPLTSLKLQLQLSKKRVEKIIHDDTEASQEITHSLQNCLRQTNSLAKLIDDLLDVTRIQSGKMPLDIDEVNLSTLITDVVGRFTDSLANAGCTVNLHLQDGISGHWDYTRLEQVLVNLITNAIKYAPGTPIDITSSVANNEAVFSVKDYGCGINKEKHKEIFERFTRVNTDKNVGGLGLGLYIVNRIIEAHKGIIEVESEPGKGSQFTVHLPLS